MMEHTEGNVTDIAVWLQLRGRGNEVPSLFCSYPSLKQMLLARPAVPNPLPISLSTLREFLQRGD